MKAAGTRKADANSTIETKCASAGFPRMLSDFSCESRPESERTETDVIGQPTARKEMVFGSVGFVFPIDKPRDADS
ncbi:hypothetical protein YK56LOC_69630 [Caballeronia sp. HLA56]